MLRRAFLALPPALLLAGPALAAAPPPAKGGEQQPRFISLPVFSANIIRSNRTRGVISLESGLDVPDPKLRARIPLLFRSDLGRRLSYYTSNLAPGARPDLDILSPLLQKQVDVTVGQAGARFVILNVLIN